MKKRRLLAGLMSLAVVASLGSCEINHDQNTDGSSGIVSTENGDPQIRRIYELYKDNGGTLTYEEWLASIKGEKGDKGDTGVTGADGSSVRTGSGVPNISLGKDGDSYIDLNTYDYYLKSNGAWTKVGNIKGGTGEQGVAGVSVSSITKTSSEGNVDTYTIIYSDGTTTTFTVTNGEDGAAGADGAQGIQGVPGADGHTPVITIGENGNWTIDGVDTGIAATGAKGDKGETGADGNDAPHYGETHKVTYNLVGGTMPSGKSVSETVTWGDCLDLPVPTKAGYVFVGWFYESSDVNDPSRQWTNRDAVFKDITLTAHWETATYTITLNTDGGSVSTTSIKAQYRGSYTLPEPTKSGCNFLGWYNGTTRWDLTGTYTETSDVTLTAHWEKKTIYTITLNLNGGTCSVTSIQTNQDGTYSLPSYENVTREGYVFKGWFNGTEKWDYSGNYPLTSDITLAANWEAVANYTLTLNLNGGNYNGSTDNYTFNFDNSNKYNGGEQLPVPAKAGYTFVGYGIGANLVSDCSSLTDYSLSGSTLKAFYKADDGSVSGDVYEFGSYPKGKVKDASLIQSLATATDTDNDGWLNYNGKEYTSYSASYFEVEPLLWKVLDSSTGLLFAIDVIDQQQFYYSRSSRNVNGLNVYANNYQYSNLRAWLNGYDGTSYSVSNYTGTGFLNTAFTAEEQAMIMTTTVDNSASSTKYNSNPYFCENTQDKIFALSYSELTDRSYGFTSDSSRVAYATDYAKRKRVYANGGADYWLRSPDSSDDYARRVGDDGALNCISDVSNDNIGVRPSFRIKIS